jgi:hypothetical protein
MIKRAAPTREDVTDALDTQSLNVINVLGGTRQRIPAIR